MNKRLKKYSPRYIGLNILYTFVPLVLLFLLEYFFMGVEKDILFSPSYIILNLVLAFFVTLLFYACAFAWGDLQRRLMKRTERDKVDGVFPYTESFYASHAFLFLDVAGGKMGVIFAGNPHNFQVVDGRQIEKAWTDNRPMSRNLSRGVRFCIRVNGILVSCDTFITNTTFAVDSPRVKEGMEKAEYYCGCIERLKQNAYDIANGLYGTNTQESNRTEEFDYKKRMKI